MLKHVRNEKSTMLKIFFLKLPNLVDFHRRFVYLEVMNKGEKMAIVFKLEADGGFVAVKADNVMS